MEVPSMMPTFKNFYGQEGQNQEFKDFLSSLPRENWLINPTSHLYQYQGFWVNAQVLQAVLKSQTQFKAQPTDLFLVTTPKAGTVWLKAMVYATVNRLRYPPSPPDEQHPLLVKNPHELVPFVEFSYIGDHVPEFSSFEGFDSSPRILSTHLPSMSLPESIMSSKCKIVYLCRNPKDTLVSFWCFNNKVHTQQQRQKPIEEQFECFCKGVSVYGPWIKNSEISSEISAEISVFKMTELILFRDISRNLMKNPKNSTYFGRNFGFWNDRNFGRNRVFKPWYGPFWDHVLGYWKQSLVDPERVCFLRFEDMKREPMVHLRKLAEFLGFPFSSEEEKEGVLEGILKLCSLDNLSNLEVNKTGELASGFKNNAFFRRGEVGDWVNHLTPEMGVRLDQITEEKLHGSGLKF